MRTSRHLRARLDELHAAALRSPNRFFALRGDTLLAAGPVEAHAASYMQPDCVLLQVEADFPAELIERARKMWQYVPFRSCWVAVKGCEDAVILKATAHVANKLAREGWTVARLHRA